MSGPFGRLDSPGSNGPDPTSTLLSATILIWDAFEAKP